MDASEVNVLTGMAINDAAKDSVNYGLDSMASKYCKAWEIFGGTNLSAC
jgi:hypothetical protein